MCHTISSEIGPNLNYNFYLVNKSTCQITGKYVGFSTNFLTFCCLGTYYEIFDVAIWENF